MAGDVSTTEARRFSAIGILHPTLGTDARALRRTLGPGLRQPRTVNLGPPGWRIYHAEFERDGSLYPSHLVDAETRRRDTGGYAHDIFIALCNLPRLGTAMWIASPYVRLLDEIHSVAAQRLERPAMQYVGVDMKRFYALLAEGMDHISAKRVILRILAEENVELVSLTGKMPLHSDIHRHLAKSTLPFGVGAQVEFGGRRARVTVNRAGLVHWFQSERQILSCALALVSRLGERGVLTAERLYPLTQEAKKAVEALAD